MLGCNIEAMLYRTVHMFGIGSVHKSVCGLYVISYKQESRISHFPSYIYIYFSES